MLADAERQRARVGIAPNNLSVPRHMVLTVIRNEVSQASLPGELSGAAWNESSLRTLLALF
jgi:hypothetical protein